MILTAISFTTMTAFAAKPMCLSKYENEQKRLHSTSNTIKAKTPDVLLLGGVSVMVSATSIGGGPAAVPLALLGMSTIGTGDLFLSKFGDVKAKRDNIDSSILLFNDAYIGKGNYLTSATLRIRSYFSEPSITKSQVAASIKRLIKNNSFCKKDDFASVGGSLSLIAKDIISTRAINNSKNVVNTNRKIGKSTEDTNNSTLKTNSTESLEE